MGRRPTAPLAVPLHLPTRERRVHRFCFTLQVDPDRLDEYRARHDDVWPEMLEALRDAGWRDYHLYLRDDGLLVGTLLTEDLDAARAAMDATEVNARWQAEMAPFFTGLDDRRPDEGFVVLDHVFHLESSLRDAGLPTPTASRADDERART